MIFFGDFDGLVFGIGKQRKAGGDWGGGMCLKKGRFFETAKSCYWQGKKENKGEIEYLLLKKSTLILPRTAFVPLSFHFST